ncbi:HAD family hydrolase [Microlunatus soli]|uniref:Haloacid dehalogenase-like hydrolase n=1 Tax=Microlunatus soli TaxID=630515 RepID=A0A1H1YYJ6_9ACTN|nr:HAD family hydrolase [Microlunatus soli]SDT26409.1 haloacid dehalogenase-like hydrolase [Microlunatus soli]
MRDNALANWRPGPAKDAILGYLAGIDDIPVDERIACIDNDGTMWCERPNYVQYDFFLDALQRSATADATLADRPEFAAVLDQDAAKIGELGLARIAGALASLYDRRTPDEFAAAVDAFVGGYRHPKFGRAVSDLVYRPMLELIGVLRSHDFTVAIVTGGGTEFVRRIAGALYGVPPELVVGTLIGYRFDRDDQQSPLLRRSVSLLGSANEGEPKVAHIQTQLGRAPIVAVGNSGGDREMLEWAAAGPRPGLALLIDHDDADREYAYAGSAATFTDAEPITATANRLGWTTVSMARDWECIFDEPDGQAPDQDERRDD